MKNILCLAIWVLGISGTGSAFGQKVQAFLTGPLSEGNGRADVTLGMVTLDTNIFFTGLGSPPSAVYILCCDASVANAKPALKALTVLLTPQGGVGNASYDTNDPVWDDEFLRARGGNVSTARQDLSNALSSKKAHIVVITGDQPTGEIYGTFDTPVVPFTARMPINSPAKMNTPPVFGAPSSIAQGKATILTATSGVNEFDCHKKSDRCVFPVYVSSTLNAKGEAIACESRIDYSLIRVPKADETPTKKIRIVWQLVEGNIGDAGDYRFTDDGVVLVGNDSSKDFNGKGKESADGKKFKWMRIGVRTGVQLNYVAFVERVDSTGARLACNPADPRIVNKN